MLNNNSPVITTIIAVFNGEETIKESIDSVLGQTYLNKELIVIDGGSTDGTISILKSYQSRLTYWVSEPDQGIYDAWNKALKKANGDWICFIGADDYLWDQHILEKSAASLIKTPSDVRLVYGKVALINKANEVIYTIGEPWEKSALRFHYTMSIPHPGTMHRKSLFQELGPFDKNFRIAGDYELLLRELKNKSANFIPLIMVGMRQGGASSNNKDALLQLFELRKAQLKHGYRWPAIQWIFAVVRVYIRLFLWKIVGEKQARKLLDCGRALSGKKPYWTRT